MDKTIMKVKKNRGYIVENKQLKNLYYVDSTVLISQSKVDPQKMLYQFNQYNRKKINN